MYIKFCRSYDGDKNDEPKAKVSPASKLSVQLEQGKGNQPEGNARLYRAMCAFLAVTCLILLLVIIVLSVKFQARSTACQEKEEKSSLPSNCSISQLHIVPSTPEPKCSQAPEEVIS